MQRCPLHPHMRVEEDLNYLGLLRLLSLTFVVTTVTLGSPSIICLPLSISFSYKGVESKFKDFSATNNNICHCCARGSYGCHTICLCPLTSCSFSSHVDLVGCLEVGYLCSVHYYEC
jgi:hypothetical protein